MAKAKAAETGTTLATQSRGAALVMDELAEYGEDFVVDDDGLGPAEQGDFKIAAYVINMKGTDANGRKLPEDSYYNTVDETTKDEVDAVFLHRHVSHLWSTFDNEKSETVIHCRSFDRVTGKMADGSERPCEGCPDREWKTVDGKRSRACGEVFNIFGIDSETQMPFVFRFKKTSMPVIRAYLQKYFIGRRVVKDKATGASRRVNYPLFAFRTKMRTRMSDDKKYALPVLERGELLTIDELEARKSDQQFIKDNLEALFGTVEKQDAKAAAADAPDTSFEPDKFAGGAGEDIIDAEGESSNAA